MVWSGPVTSEVRIRHSKATGASAMRGGATAREGQGGEPGERQLVDLGRRVDAGLVHRLGIGLGDEVDHELAGLEDVGGGVLQPALLRHDADRDGGRIVAHHVEEAEGRGIDDGRRATGW